MSKSWDSYIKQFRHYLKIERSLSENSIEAYYRDVQRLSEFVEMNYQGLSPLEVSSKELQAFVRMIGELELSEFTQARMISGIKAFYRFLMYEDLVKKDPA